MIKYKKIIFCGEKILSVRCLDYLKKNYKIKIIAICTRKKSKVWYGKQVLREYAKKNRIKIIKTKNIKKNQADLLVSVLFPSIINKNVLNKFKLSINLHQAPLPEFKGCNGASHAIINDSKYFGSTIHLLTDKLDSGAIIDKKIFIINKNITAKELYEYNDYIAYDLFKKNIGKILLNKFSTVPQKTTNKAFTRDSLKDKKIKFNMSKNKIWNKVRGNEFFPFEPCFINLGKGRKVYLLSKPWKYSKKPEQIEPWRFDD